MNFELTEDQLQIKTSVREFAESELKPNVMEWDEAQHLPLESDSENMLVEQNYNGVVSDNRDLLL